MIKHSTSKLYRARESMLLGVCLGIARHWSIPVAYLRLGVVVVTLFTGLWPGVALYFLAAILLKLEPVLPPKDQGEAVFYARFSSSRAIALHDLSQRMERLGARIGTMEDAVTRKDFDWEQRLKG